MGSGFGGGFVCLLLGSAGFVSTGPPFAWTKQTFGIAAKGVLLIPRESELSALVGDEGNFRVFRFHRTFNIHQIGLFIS
jgi:hypothetical protein